jgi:hypothetical protein
MRCHQLPFYRPRSRPGEGDHVAEYGDGPGTAFFRAHQAAGASLQAKRVEIAHETECNIRHRYVGAQEADALNLSGILGAAIRE